MSFSLEAVISKHLLLLLFQLIYPILTLISSLSLTISILAESCLLHLCCSMLQPFTFCFFCCKEEFIIGCIWVFVQIMHGISQMLCPPVESLSFKILGLYHPGYKVINFLYFVSILPANSSTVSPLS